MASDQNATNPRRRALYTAVAAICVENGFDKADKQAIETLTEMMQSCISEIGRSSRAFTEVACRSEPLAGDVFMALIEMGINVESLFSYSKISKNKIMLTAPLQTTNPQVPKILQAGVKHSHPSYIAEHYPAFPDPHAYIRTPTHKQPITEYYAIREKAASQKRDVERALTRFIAKTGDTQLLFNDETNLFPLIACKCVPHPYLDALLPKDQVFEEDESIKDLTQKLPKSENETAGADSISHKKDESEGEAIDNPYLRSFKSPNKRR